LYPTLLTINPKSVIMKTKISSKVFLILVLIILSPIVLFSQWKKGDWLAEGSIGNLQVTSSQLRAGSFKNKNSDIQTVFSLRPSLGYFVSQNVMIGATFGFGYTSLKNYSYYPDGKTYYSGIYRGSSLSIIPAIRYYFKTESEKNKFYVQLGAGPGIGVFNKQENTNYDPSGAVSGYYKVTYPKVPTSFYGQAFIGFNHFLTTNVAFNSAVGYNYARGKTTTVVTTSGNIVSIGGNQTQVSNSSNLFWSLGFTMIIPGKKNR